MAASTACSNLESLLERRAQLPPSACLGCTDPFHVCEHGPSEEVVATALLLPTALVPAASTTDEGANGVGASGLRTFFGAPVLCSVCASAVSLEQPQSLAAIASVFDAGSLLEAGLAHREHVAKAALRLRTTTLATLDAAVAPLFMPPATFESFKAIVSHGATAWPADSAAPLVADCLDELGLRCFLSAAQAVELLGLLGAAATDACAHEICHRILDRWHVARDVGPLGVPNCEYGYQWEDPRDRTRLERAAAQPSALERRASLLASLFLEGERALDASRACLGSAAVAASRCLRRDALLARWRAVAPAVGRFARACIVLYEEVHYRPGSDGALATQAHFEALQRGCSPTEAEAAMAIDVEDDVAINADDEMTAEEAPPPQRRHHLAVGHGRHLALDARLFPRSSSADVFPSPDGRSLRRVSKRPSAASQQRSAQRSALQRAAQHSAARSSPLAPAADVSNAVGASGLTPLLSALSTARHVPPGPRYAVASAASPRSPRVLSPVSPTIAKPKAARGRPCARRLATHRMREGRVEHGNNGAPSELTLEGAAPAPLQPLPLQPLQSLSTGECQLD